MSKVVESNEAKQEVAIELDHISKSTKSYTAKGRVTRFSFLAGLLISIVLALLLILALLYVFVWSTM